MANTITNKKVNEVTVRMSNGLTSVFIETICLAGADLAKDQIERDLMIWFGQRDWIIIGMGAEGFDISDIIWEKTHFEQQKTFVKLVIDSVHEKRNWEHLSYNPNSEILFNTLNVFREMIESFTLNNIESISESDGIFEFKGDISKYQKCEKHKIFMHWQGCVICNNEL